MKFNIDKYKVILPQKNKTNYTYLTRGFKLTTTTPKEDIQDILDRIPKTLSPSLEAVERE